MPGLCTDESGEEKVKHTVQSDVMMLALHCGIDIGGINGYS